MTDLPHVKKPCVECPWRTDAQPGRFTEERWRTLSESCRQPGGDNPQMHDVLFACHITKEGREQACAGWLAVEGAGHLRIRIALLSGQLPSEALQPQEGWPALHPDFAATAAHDLGYELD